MSLTWLRSFKKWRTRLSLPARKLPPRRSIRPSIEALEDRITPANYTVTNLGDAGAGMGNSGDLRYCINQADQKIGQSTITFQAGLNGTIDLKSTLSIAPPPQKPQPLAVKIVNPGGPNTITIERDPTAQGNFSLFSVAMNTGATLQGLTIQKGMAVQGGAINTQGGVILTNDVVSGNTSTGDGGAIWAFSAVTLHNTIVSGNTAGGNGGGIFVSQPSGTTIDQKSTISGNTAQGSGGGIYFGNVPVARNPLKIQQSTISGNTAKTGNGGGIWNGATGQGLFVTQSTISGNPVLAKGKGGGLYNAGIAALSNTTINGNTANQGAGDDVAPGATTTKVNVTEAGNTAKGAGGAAPSQALLDEYSPGIGGGSYVESGGTESLVNTIIAQNTADDGSPDVDGIFDDLGHNFIGDGTGGNFVNGSNGDQVGDSGNPLDPMLGPLQDNGGGIDTQLPLAGSPVIDAGDNSYASATDERDYYRIINNIVDIGAVEYNSSPAPIPTVTGISPSTGDEAGGTSVTISGSNFTGATEVDFGSMPVTNFTVESDNTIVAQAPAGSPGTVDVTVIDAYGTSATSSVDQFTYTAAATLSGTLSGNAPAGTVQFTGTLSGGITGTFSTSNLAPLNGTGGTFSFSGTDSNGNPISGSGTFSLSGATSDSVPVSGSGSLSGTVDGSGNVSGTFSGSMEVGTTSGGGSSASRSQFTPAGTGLYSNGGALTLSPSARPNNPVIGPSETRADSRAGTDLVHMAQLKSALDSHPASLESMPLIPASLGGTKISSFAQLLGSNMAGWPGTGQGQRMQSLLSSAKPDIDAVEMQSGE